ncbi:hypothetical protein [Anaeromyxobacter paludicola]|uniref:Uncharacterized protein n=1 Tax=Anaeromyxobacter paludicola TaxID=2918171 RepID=A0ABM7X718_9BACT|nr:hypothetical protein [Anaeromyxobacter paludicola]BDG07627.1 hypothetical protein AMPC_07400 [Anaeromyxobacter paludicola]
MSDFKDPEALHEDPEAPGDPTASRGFVADAVRKAVLAGVGALFLTEEGAKKLARDWKLPKDVLTYVLGQAASAKQEILRVFSEETRKFMESEALRREFLKLLTSMSIEVKAEIRLREAGPGKVKAHVEGTEVKPRFRKRRGEEDPGGGEA